MRRYIPRTHLGSPVSSADSLNLQYVGAKMEGFAVKD